MQKQTCLKIFFSGLLCAFSLIFGVTEAQAEPVTQSDVPKAMRAMGPSIPVSPEQSGTVNPFDYYKFGSVQVQLEAEINQTVPGVPLGIRATVINDNDYPVVDGAVYLKIFRKQADEGDAHANGFFLIDQFFVKEDLNLSAKGTTPFNFEYQVPVYAVAGEYQIAAFFITAQKFNLLGLSFTDDVVGNTFSFTVKSENTGTVEFNKNTVKLNGENYHFAAYPPRTKTGAEALIQAELKNTTAKTQTIPISYTLYAWDGLQAENILERKQETVEINANETKIIAYKTVDSKHPVYFLVIEAAYQDTKSILDIRFVREGVEQTRINFPTITAYPLKKGEKNTLFSSLHNAGQSSVVENGKLVLTLLDENNQKIHSYVYEGGVTGAMMGVKDEFTPQKNYDNFTIKAELFTNGKLVDQAEIIYDCHKLNPQKCPTKLPVSATVKKPLKMLAPQLMILILSGGFLILLGILMATRKNNQKPKLRRGNFKNFIFFLIVSALTFCLAFSQKAEAKDVVWNKTETGYFYYLGYYYSTWNLGLANPNFTIKYHTKITNQTTGKEITDGAEVKVGDKLKFEVITPVNTDIYWVGTGFSSDSPYGAWMGSAARPSSACTTENFVNKYTCTGYDPLLGSFSFPVDVYIDLSVNPPLTSVKQTGTAGLSCDEPNICKVTSAGTIKPNFSFGDTYGKFYYDYVVWYQGGYTAPGVCVPTTPTMKICNGSPTGDCLIGSPCSGSLTDYSLSIPAQTISYSLTAFVPSQPPSAPTITGPTNLLSGTAGTYTFSGSVDPEKDTIRYEVDWNKDGTPDQLLPSSGYVASGSSQTATHTWTAPAKVTFQARACDKNSSCSGWKTYTVDVFIVNANCGSQNNQKYSYEATGWNTSYTFCEKQCAYTNTCTGTSSPASPVFPTAGDTTTWTCLGKGEGSKDATCSASHDHLDGQCGTQNKQKYLYTDTVWKTDLTFCAKGKTDPASPSFPDYGEKTKWKCLGDGTGAESPSCSAERDNPPEAKATLTTDKTTLEYGQSAVLSWTTQNAESCFGWSIIAATGKNGEDNDGGWTTSTDSIIGKDKKEPANSNARTQTVAPTTKTTYYLECYNLKGNSVSDKVTIDVKYVKTLEVKINGKGAGVISGGFEKDGKYVESLFCSKSVEEDNKTCAVGTPDGVIFKLNAQADKISGSDFDSWDGDAKKCGTNMNCEITMDKNKSITGKFNLAKTDGKCGTENGKVYSYVDLGWSSRDFCQSGITEPVEPLFPEPGATASWECQGLNKGATVPCNASREKEPVTLEAFLSAEPNNGNVGFVSKLSTFVSGTATGTINYTDPKCGASGQISNFDDTKGTFQCTYPAEGNYTASITVTRQEITKTATTDIKVSNTPNNPPDKPFLTCAGSAYVNEAVILTAYAEDADKDQIKYLADWADGSAKETMPVTGYVPSGTAQNFKHSYTKIGNYTIAVQAEDSKGAQSAMAYCSISIQDKPVNQTPIAYIDQPAENPLTFKEGDRQSVYLEGHGEDAEDGKITDKCEWYEIANKQQNCASGTSRAKECGFSLSKNYLVVGTHFLCLRVQDKQNAWSTNAPYREITVQGRDTTPPTCTVTAQCNGQIFDPKNWCKGKIDATAACADAQSGCAPLKQTATLTVNGATTSFADVVNGDNYSAECADITAKIDTTPPTVIWAPQTPAWTKTTQTFTASCSDTQSGCQQASYTCTVSTNGGTCSITAVDKVLNSKNYTSPQAKIDQTAPTCTASLNPATCTEGTVIASAVCNDAESGCTGNPANQTLATNGAKATFTVTDLVGNSGQCTSGAARIGNCTEPPVEPEVDHIVEIRGMKSTGTSQAQWDEVTLEMRKQVASLTRGFTAQTQGGGTTIKFNINNNVALYTGEVKLDSASIALVAGEKKTLVVQGGNLKIQSNLNPTGVLGIIVLKEGANTGNIYVDKNVTDIKAILFAEGTVFSQANSNDFDTVEERDDAFTNQLYWKGSVISDNTVGGEGKGYVPEYGGTCPKQFSNECNTTDYNVQDGIEIQGDFNYFRSYYDGCPATDCKKSSDLQNSKAPFIIEYDPAVIQTPPPGFELFGSVNYQEIVR